MATYSDTEKERILSFPIASVLAHLGKRTDHRGEMYYSPFRDEKEPSFHVKRSTNLWMDFGSGEGGNVLTLVSRLENIPIQKAWDFLADLDPGIVVDDTPKRERRRDVSTKIVILRQSPLKSTLLLNYGMERGVHRHLLERYCSEITFSIEGYPGHHYTGIGFPAGDGWVIRLPRERGGKRCTGSACSFLGASGAVTAEPTCGRVEVFEGFFDFLSWMELKDRTRPFCDICVLNSVNNLSRAIPFISAHSAVSCWTDRDEAGEKAFSGILSACSGAYHHLDELASSGSKDLNEHLLKSRPTIVKNNSIHKPYSFTIKK